MSRETSRLCSLLAARLMLVSAVFAALVSAVMLADYVRAKRAFLPAEAALEAMRPQITLTPDDESLKRDFANLDIVYRRAILTDSSQRQAGAFLLLCAAGIFLASAAVYFQFREERPKPPDPDAARKKSRAGASFRIALGGILTACAALSAFYVWRNFYSGGADSAVSAPSFAALEELDANWTSLRGPRNDGISRSVSVSPSASFEKLWRVEVPSAGFNSPVAYGDRLFVAGADEKSRSIFCYSQKDGSMLWRCDVSAPAKSNHDEQSGPAPSTAATDGRRVYAIFPTGELVCSDMDGKLLYVKSFGTPEILYSYSSSLLVCGRELIVQMYLEKKRVLYALDSSNGREIWKSEKGRDTSWSSPSLVEHGGRRIVAVSTCTGIEAYGLEDGAFLWAADCMSGEMAPSITFGDGRIYAMNDNAAVVALNPEDGSEIWNNPDILMPGVSSPVYAAGELYVYTSGGTVSRVNAATGELVEELEAGDGFYSSPVALGRSVIAGDNAGNFYLSALGGGFRLSEPALKLGETLYATPAFSGGMMFVRTDKALYGFKISDNAEGGK